VVAEWYETFFDGLAFDVWHQLVPAQMSDAETQFLLRHLCPGDGSRCRFLDIPCGEGRLTLPMAAAGHDVVGVDLSPIAITRLTDAARATSGGVSGVVGDMRGLADALEQVGAARAGFVGAWCMGNSFGYLNPGDTTTFLEQLAYALRPGGRFVLDAAIAAESVLPHLTEHDRYEADDVSLDNVNTYDPYSSTMVTHMTLTVGDRAEQRVVRHRIMTCREIVESLESVGLMVDDIFGELDDTPFTLGANRCLVVTTRR
jgi:SAM-dependent methyltransferase